MPSKKPAKKAPSKSRQYSAFDKKLKQGQKGYYAQRLAEQKHNLEQGLNTSGKRSKGFVTRGSDVEYKKASKAKRDFEKYANSNWFIADTVASEILKGLTAAPQVKKALRGKAGLKDYAEIAGTAASYAVPYNKIGTAINAASTARTAKGVVKGYKATAKAIKAEKDIKKAQKIAGVRSAVKSVAGAAPKVNKARKTARGVAKGVVFYKGADVASGAVKSAVIRAGKALGGGKVRVAEGKRTTKKRSGKAR